MQDTEILQELKNKTEGVFFLSESDYPFEVIDWSKNEITEDFLRGLSAENMEGAVEQVDFEAFYQKYASRSPEYQPAFDALRDNLTDLRVYRVGRVNIGIYLTGKSAEENWLGISTRSVET